MDHKGRTVRFGGTGYKGSRLVAEVAIAVMLLFLTAVAIGLLPGVGFAAASEAESSRSASAVEGQGPAAAEQGSGDAADAGESGQGSSDQEAGSQESDGAAQPEDGNADENDHDTSSPNSGSSDGSASGEETGGSDEDADSPEDTAKSSASSEDADSNEASRGDEAEKFSSGILKESIKTADGKRYTVSVEYGEDARIPEGATLSIVQVLQTPEGYDPAAAEFKDRPYDFERFVSEDEMHRRLGQLAEALGLREGEAMLNTGFLVIAIKDGDKNVKPKAAVEVTVETDAIKASDSDRVRASFFTHREAGAAHGVPLATENRSGDSAKEKAYAKGLKLSFSADKLTELGMTEVFAKDDLDADADIDYPLDDADADAADTDAADATNPDKADGASREDADGSDTAALADPAEDNAGTESPEAVDLQGASMFGVAAMIQPAFVVARGVGVQSAPYTVTWKNHDGTVLETDSDVPEGGKPAYDGATPTREATAQYTYTFAGWTSSLDTTEPKTVYTADTLPAVASDVTFTAAYEATVNSYTITWKDDDDSVLKTQEAAYGTMPNYGNPPSKQSTAQVTYAFAGWDPDPVEVTGDATYKATYRAAAVELCIQDFTTKQAVAGAQFTLTNSAGSVVWTSEPTTTSGILWIDPTTISANSTYTLKQVAASDDYFCPQGSWTLKVDSAGALTCTTNADASDLTTRNASGPYGIRFYLYNVASARITYDYNYPPGVGGQPDNVEARLDFLAYNGSYTVPLDDPSIPGYEFAGWIIDSTNRVAKHGETIRLDTVNVKSHTMKACWRNPLNVVAKTYEGGDSASATEVVESRGAFEVAQEKAMTFSSLSAVCAAYGAQNQAVGELNASEDFGFVFAQVVNGSATTRITALQYDAATHAWQYKASGSSSWTSIAQGDELQLYYTSVLVPVRWVMQAEDGSFTELDSGRFPAATVAVGSDWTSSSDLVAAVDRPIVYALGYFCSFGIGADDVAQASDLDKAGLSSFSLKNSEAGFAYREGSSGAGERLVGVPTIYVVYTETPPDGSTYLDVANNTAWPYQVNSLFVGGTAEKDDLLAQGKVVLAGESMLRVLDPQDTVAASATAQLVLIGTGTASFTLDGGFIEDAEEGTVVSAGVKTPSAVKRTALVKKAASNPLANTADVSKGTLEEAPAKVVVSFDSSLFDLVVKKTWSDDSYPEHYQVDFALYEDGVRCTTDTAASSGYYVVVPDEWAVVIPYLPTRCAYNVTEQAVRRVNGKTTIADETDKFVATYDSTSEEHAIRVANTRSSAVCQVGDQKFTTIKAAVEYIVEHAMTTGATIEMLSDYIMAESGSVTIPAGFDIALTTVEGESTKTVTRGFAGSADMFHVLGSLSVTDVVLTGKLDNALLAKDGNGGLVRVEGADASFTAGAGSVFTNGKAENGSAIYAQDGATVTLEGARVSGNRAASGGAIGVADETCRIRLSGDTYVYDNRNGDNAGNYNVYLDQDSNQVIQVVDGGLGSSAKVGVYVPNGEASALYNAHALPAKPFATYDDATKANLENANLITLVNDRLGSGPSKYGYASIILDNTVVWGETFSFTAKKQWLDDRFNVIAAPAGATATLKLSGGSTTPADSVKTTVMLDGSEAESWTYVFTGLAKYDGNGYPYEYKLSESNIPADYKQVIFTGDKATSDNPITYDAATGDGQVAIVSNYYRYTTLTVNKTVEPVEQGLKPTFEVYAVPKTGADLTNGAIRRGGVGSVSDLPIGLRGGVAVSKEAIAQDNRFYTVDGGNIWFAKVGGSIVQFHRFYDETFGEFTGSGSSVVLVSGSWQAGDVVRFESGSCSLYDGSSWHAFGSLSTSYITFSRQDGNGGVENVGGSDMGKSHTIDCSSSSAGSYTFTTGERLSSDYYYYVVETSVQETTGTSRTISGSHKLVATYDPQYEYNQLTQTVDITNVRQDYLSVDKVWPEDAASYGTCVFDVYKVTDGATVDYLKDAAKFKALVISDETAATWGQKIGEFSLPEPNGSWVHVLKDISQQDLAVNVYFARERSAGGVTILNPDVSDSSMSVDAVYSYDSNVNQITVRNMSDILCKVVDDDGTEHPFRTLNAALEYGRTRPADAGSNTVFTIEMLRDYAIPASDIMQLKANEKITLTTASTTTGDYRYHGAEGATRATIARKAGNTWSFFIVAGEVGASASTSFTLENIALDGSDIQVSYRLGNTNYYNGSFVYATNATIVLSKGGDPAAGVEMRNAKASNGGAIYAANSMVDVSDAVFANCTSTDTNGNADRGGGAIWSSGTGTSVRDSSFTACTANRRGGAVAAMANTAGTETAVAGCSFDSCTANVDAGAVYSRNYTLNVGGAQAGEACTFNGCTAVYRGGGVYHDNMTEGTVTNVTGCAFANCSTTGGNDRDSERHGGGGLNSNADTLDLAGCSFTSCTAYVRGGGVVHFNKTAAASTMADCTFTECTAQISGGGGAHLTGVVQAVDRCAFADCAALRSAGGGLDIGGWDTEKTAVVTDGAFTRCTAGNANGGGICFGGTSLTVTRGVFDTCEATTQHGGGIAVSAGGTMQELNVYGCSFSSCSAPGNNGGAIYSQTIATNIGDDPDDPAKHTTFANCSSKGNGGAVWQDRNAEGTAVTAENCTFDSCVSTNGQGGALRVTATTLDLASCGFQGCTSYGYGGSVYQGIYGAYADASSALVIGCVFHDSKAGDESYNAYGGALYTEAKTLSITGMPSEVTFQNCTSRSNGGAVCHNRANLEGSATTLETCSFKNCASTNASGAGLFTYTQTATLADTTFEECAAKGSGGSVYHNPYNFAGTSSMTLSGSSFSATRSEAGYGGAMYTSATALSITGAPGTTTFKGCTSYYAGGGVLHDRNTENSTATLSQVSFDTCESTNQHGGGLVTYATKLDLSDSSFANCTARGSSGAAHQGVNGNYVASSDATVTRCTFENCESRTGNAGTLYTNALTLSVTGKPGVTTFKDSVAYQNAGAIQHDRNWQASKTTLSQCSFDTCAATTQSGGAVLSYATKLDVADCSFANCTSKSTAGGVYQSVNGNYVASSDATVARCTFANCKSTNASSGALYTNALTLELTGQAQATTFENCEASGNGGAVSHDRNWESAVTTVQQCSFRECTSKTARGGALYSIATKLHMSDASCTDTTARGAGGAVYHSVNNSYAASTETIVSHGVFTNCASETGSGGAIYSESMKLEVNGGTGTSGFVGCTCAYDGGAVYQGRNSEGSSAKLVDCVFNTCTATYSSGNNRGGGAYIRARALLVDGCSFRSCDARGNGGCLAIMPDTASPNSAEIKNSSFADCDSRTGSGGAICCIRSVLTLLGSSISSCTAAGSGGAVYFDDWENRPATIESCSIADNSAGTNGGGVYFCSNANLTLRDGTNITGNKLGNAVVENAAGIYLNQNRSGATLVLGAEGVEEDTITVYNNTTNEGAQSNVRLIRSNTWDSKVKRYYDRENSVSLLSNLVKPGVGIAGTVGVCNPGPENTRFGLGDVGNRTGVEYIMSDIDTLIGKIDPSDLYGLRIIWYAPPVCKITDQYGRILTYDNGKTAAFSSLSAAYEVANVLRDGYIVDDQGVTPSQIQIQMLVADYTLEANMQPLKRDITLTTAAAGTGEYDYPVNATSARCTITRGTNVGGAMFTAASGNTFTVSGITIDGGNWEERPLEVSFDGGIVHGQPNATVVLGENSVLRNSAVAEGCYGGAVYVTGGTDPDKPALVMERNASIEGCSAGYGGGVYLTGGVLFEMNDASRIENCAASNAGGAVYVSPYATMSFADNPNGVIRNNRITDASGEGAGIYLPSNDSKLYLKLGAKAVIAGNYVDGTDDASRRNGEDEYPKLRQDIFIGETADPTTSITLTGDLSLEPGSIWVWARTATHYEPETQFAVIASDSSGNPAFTPLESTLAVFRDAQDNDATGIEDNDPYLFGVQGEGTYVIWSNVAREKVILRKVAQGGSGYASLSGAVFTVYRGSSAQAYVAKRADGTSETLAGLRSGDNGVFWVGELPLGTYYLEETTVPDGYSNDARWFKLTIDKNGATMTQGYATRTAAASS